MLFFGLAYLMIYIYPIIGLIQIIDAFHKYIKIGKPAAYYTDLEKYALMLLGYIIGLVGLIQILEDVAIGTALDLAFFLYFLLVPIIIGTYKKRISNKEYFEEIEKLIF